MNYSNSANWTGLGNVDEKVLVVTEEDFIRPFWTAMWLAYITIVAYDIVLFAIMG
jgi:hypothetical protein